MTLPQLSFARKLDGTWRLCYDYSFLNAITWPAVEPLQGFSTLMHCLTGRGGRASS